MKGRKEIAQWIGMLAMLLCGALHAQQQGTVTYVYTDPQGTPLAETDAHGNITAIFDYTPYGSQAMGTPPNGPGYTEHVNDPDTGLSYMQARYYDPATGRFLSTDPVGPSQGGAFNFNRYVYANNNPVMNIDPDGRQSAFDAGVWANQAAMANSGNPATVQQLNQMNVAQAKAVLGSMVALSATPAAALVGRTAFAVASTTMQSGSLATGLLMNSEAVAASTAIVSEGVAVANGAPSPFSAEALVVRGGGAANQTAAKIDAAIGPSRTAGVNGFSAQCNGGGCLSQLGSALRNGEVGVTTVGAIRGAGGEVVATPGMGNHVTVTGLTGEQASPLMMIQKNPNPKTN